MMLLMFAFAFAPAPWFCREVKVKVEPGLSSGKEDGQKVRARKSDSKEGQPNKKGSRCSTPSSGSSEEVAKEERRRQMYYEEELKRACSVDVDSSGGEDETATEEILPKLTHPPRKL